MLLGDHLDRWLDRSRLTTRATTQASRLRYVEGFLRPHLGHMDIGDLTADDLDALWAHLSKTLSPQTVVHIRSTLGRALVDAQRRGLTSVNVAYQSVRPRVPRRALRPWSHDETRAFLASEQGSEMWHVWVMLATTGIRRGEACGLTWADIDLDRRLLHVERSLDFEGTLQPPKTHSGRRTVPMPPITCEALRAALGPSDAPVVGLSSAALSHRFRRAVKRAGMRPTRLHDLRHMVATELLAIVDAETVRGVLGHTHVSTTLAFYAHPAPAAAAAAIDRLGAAFA